ncbi:MAG TPA: prolipoprotein diacylglyceryl transferase family protein, partial [Candidatus Peribacteraceae bacterium]|nr:prolipoprotein diacylglyceryl transferase family protein [Candidatus Peribacteraceae bacterium]
MFEAFSIGPFLIWTYAVFLLLAVWTSSEFFFRLARSARLSIEPFKQHAWLFLLAFVLGGRLTAILMDYRVYLRDLPRMFIIWDGGFSFLGAAIGIGVVLFWTTKDQRSTFLQWLDVLLPATSFGLFFDWLGKFAAGHAYGRPTDHFWGVTYEA